MYLKTLVPMLFVCLFLTQGKAQNKIQFGKDQCSHCGMIIRDKLHIAVAIDKNGDSKEFDAIECLINFLKKNDEKKFQTLLVADYGHNGKYIDAKEATYLKCKNIPSPMGAFLSAFSNSEEAMKTQKDKGGELYNWKEIKEKFKESSFGLQLHQHFRPDAYAPMGLMGDHLHHRGGIMMSVRYMHMEMSGNRSGSASIPSESILPTYMASPERMNMDMVMVGLMYAPLDNLTVMIMQSYLTKNMNLINRMGNTFQTHSAGLGDLKFTILYGIFHYNNHSFHLNSGMSIPTGITDVRDDTPMANSVKLPYNMQIGSGTYDVTIGGTYKGFNEKVSWGIQQINTLRTGLNNEGYRLGNLYELNTWGAFKMLDWMSLSGRISGAIHKNLNGKDEELNPMMAPAADATNYGYRKINGYLGTNISFPQQSQLKRLKLGLEFGIPIVQNYNGIQMNESSSFTVGIRYTSL